MHSGRLETRPIILIMHLLVEPLFCGPKELHASPGYVFQTVYESFYSPCLVSKQMNIKVCTKTILTQCNVATANQVNDETKTDAMGISTLK
jgi:hypothetical protein